MPDALDALIHQPVRLRLMTLLHRNRDVATTWLQATLGLTPGNLDSHLKRLAAAGYVDHYHALPKDGFRSHVRITRQGEAAFLRYLGELRALLEEAEGSASQKNVTGK